MKSMSFVSSGVKLYISMAISLFIEVNILFAFTLRKTKRDSQNKNETNANEIEHE